MSRRGCTPTSLVPTAARTRDWHAVRALLRHLAGSPRRVRDSLSVNLPDPLLDAMGWGAAPCSSSPRCRRGCSASGFSTCSRASYSPGSTPRCLIWPMVAMNVALSLINLWTSSSSSPHATTSILRGARGRPGRRVPAARHARARRRHPEVPARLGLGRSAQGGRRSWCSVATRRWGWCCSATTATEARVQLDYVTPRYRASPRRVRVAPEQHPARARVSRADPVQHDRPVLRTPGLSPRP